MGLKFAPKYHEEAIQRAQQLAPIIRELRGYSLSRIAAELNKRKVNNATRSMNYLETDLTPC